MKSVHHPFKTYQLPFLSPRFPEATSSPHLNPISQKDKTSDAQVSHFAVAGLPAHVANGQPAPWSWVGTQPRCCVLHNRARGLSKALVSILAGAELPQSQRKVPEAKGLLVKSLVSVWYLCTYMFHTPEYFKTNQTTVLPPEI